jgi:hypothetical protein
VLVIDPNHMNVQQHFAIDNSQCAGPQGLAIGPNPQIMLGCTGTGPAPYQIPKESVVISAIDGSTIFDIPVNGVDEVWYNPLTIVTSLPPITTLTRVREHCADHRRGRCRRGRKLWGAPTWTKALHSIAVDPSQNIAYVMSAHVSGGPDGLCPFSCMGFFQPVGTDDPPAVVGKKK